MTKYIHLPWTVSIAKHRAVGRSENSGVPEVMWGHNLPPPVEIGLTDVPKIGGSQFKS